jgi:orotate phosphoribosyltransferase
MDFDYEKIQLKKFINDNALVVSNTPITLSSGKLSHHYYDIKKVALHPAGIDLLSRVMLAEVMKFGSVGSVGGLEVGAIPISTGISMKSYEIGRNIKTFYVRKKPKEHGLKKVVEGNAEAPVVIVDDVITKGDSIVLAINALRHLRKKMLGVVTVIDRGGGKSLLENGIKFSSIFTEKDFSKHVRKRLREIGCVPKPSEL